MHRYISITQVEFLIVHLTLYTIYIPHLSKYLQNQWHHVVHHSSSLTTQSQCE